MTRILCALSGGVDSSVAALLLKRQGYEVLGVFLRNGVRMLSRERWAQRGCCSLSDARDAARVADILGIPFHSLDFAAEFEGLVDFFVREYGKGRTPNPCILCNRDFKFGELFRIADGLGAEAVATGHYARIKDGSLLRARDLEKDQSYFLFGIERERLPRVLFPLGDLRKAEVRSLAREAGLPTASKPESMEICFVPEGDYRVLLRERGRLTPGRFRSLEGEDLGPHEGYEAFTIGQRRGLPALGEARYVVALRPERAEVVLGRRSDLACGGCRLESVNWLGSPPPDRRVEVKIRARSEARGARLQGEPEDRGAELRFEEPQEAVTPGQAVVLYRGDLVLGGGWIRESLPIREGARKPGLKDCS